jgi:hypothetical protein
MLFCDAVFGNYPFVASIIVQKTEVRSGPDFSYYPTSLLRFGDKVEIYFASDDWYAIRPPLGSFSWVSAGHVSLGGGNVGVILTAGLASRIGSDMTNSCNTVQVKLKRGEKILVLDQKETPENIASPLWFKIAPPSGEYRWISRAAVDPNFRNENSSKPNSSQIKTAEYLTQPSNLQDYKLVVHDNSETSNNVTIINDSPPPLILPSSETDYSTQSNSKNNGAILQVNNSELVQAPPKNFDKNKKNINTKNNADAINTAANNAAKNIANKNNSTITTTTPTTKNPPSLRFDNNNIDAGNRVAAAVNTTGRNYNYRKTNGVNLNFQRVFEELQSETVAALTGQTDDWIFVTLIEEANRLYNSAETDVEMEKIYHIIESLKRGRAVRQDIAKRQTNKNANYNQPIITNYGQTTPIDYLTAPPTTPNGTAPNTNLTDKIELTSNKTTTPNSPATTIPEISQTTKTLSGTVDGNDKNQFDISGKLGMFEPLPLKHPPFAVVDSGGSIICLLTPEQGVNLKQYVGKLVGVNGIRGIYRKTGQADSQHITVKTITIIEK